MDMNPLYLMIPGGVACCFAFMLPVATPPNAIVFSYGHLKVIDMVSAYSKHGISQLCSNKTSCVRYSLHYYGII